MRKPEGKRPVGRPKSRWDDSIKMYLRMSGCELKSDLSGVSCFLWTS